jgi:hypothetical protein
MKVFIFSMLTGLAVGSSVMAAPLPSPNPPSPTDVQPTNDGGAAALAADEGITLDAAKQHIALQGAISDFIQNSAIAQQAGFAELYVKHNPFQIVLSFDRAVPEPAISALVPAALKPYILIEATGKLPQAQLDTVKRLTGLFALFKGKLAVGYSPQSKRFFVDTADNSIAAAITALVPADLKSFVTINPGALPKSASSTTAVPTGVVAGDWIDAGWTFFTPAKTQWCTAAFPITFGANL